MNPTPTPAERLKNLALRYAFAFANETCYRGPADALAYPQVVERLREARWALFDAIDELLLPKEEVPTP